LVNNTKIVFEQEKSTFEEALAFYTDYYAKLDTLQGGKDKVANANALSLQMLAIAESAIKEELALQKVGFEEKKKISEAEKKDLIANADFLKAEETKRINGSLLSERDKNKALEEINAGYLENVAIITKNFTDSEKTRKEEEAALEATAFQIKLLAIEEQGLQENELKRALLQAELDEKNRLIAEDLENEKITAKQAQALRLLEERKFAKAKRTIDKEEAKAKRALETDMALKSIDALQALFGESKALSIASALINTYKGITAALEEPTLAQRIIGVTFATATGFAAVKNIMKTNKNSSGSGGGSSAGGSTLSTPTSVFESPAKTQTIAKLQDAPAIDTTPQLVPVLVVENFDEVKNNQQIKIQSK